MKNKALLFFSALFLFFGPIFGQPPSSINYKGFMKDYQSHFDAFAQSGAALSNAAAAHVEAIESIFQEEGISLEADKKRDSRRRENLYNWVLQWAPVYAGAFYETPEDLTQSIEVWVNDFGDEFGLSNESRNVIRGNLLNYVNSYVAYQETYTTLQTTFLNSGTPPPIPPPPPAPQQHHTGS